MQSLDYCEQLKTRFIDNNGKLFFVDGFKNRAFTAVKSILADSGVSSFICVVNDKKSALQIKAALSDDANTVDIISTMEDFRQMCRTAEVDAKRSTYQAEKFKNAYPRIIVTLKNNSSNVLHGELHQLNDKSSEYLDGSHEGYALSDFITDAGYGMLVIDNVYEMFAFEEVESDRVPYMNPRKHERINLKGRYYFTDVAHSYKKLARMVDSTEKAIIISNSIVNNDIISFYAAASLIHSEFSYKESKTNAKKRSQDYDSEIDEIFDNVSYGKDDVDIKSLCLQHAKGRKCYIPGDLERFGEYIGGLFNFMTKEEIFLRALAEITKKRHNASIESIIELIKNDDNTLAFAICDMFFNEKLKEELEGSVENTVVAKMSEEDASAFFAVFNNYAFYCDTGVVGDRCKVYRIYHEDSGFEDLLRRSYEDFDRNENALSATHRGEDIAFKCITTKKLLTEGELKLPLLIASQSKAGDIVHLMEKVADYSVARFADDCCSITDADIYVINYPEYDAIANNLEFASVVFFDALSDICLFDTYVKKALNMGKKANSALLVTYDNVSGLLADLWQKTWTDENESIVSIKNSKLYIRGEHPVDYNEVIESVERLYESFKDIIDKSGKVNVKRVTDQFCSVITDFTLGRAAHATEIEEYFGYFNAISPYYSAIFANSVSVGNLGREVYSEQLIPVEKGKKKRKHKKVKYVNGTVEETKKVLFNVCSKQMHNLCDIRYKDCSACELNQQIQVNDLRDFTKGIKGYFKETEKIMSKIQSDRIKRQIDDTIISTDGSSERELAKIIDHVMTVSVEAIKTLNIMLKKKASYTAPLFAEYDHVFDIKEAVQSVHHMIFIKYFEQIMGILTVSTDELKRSINTVDKAAKNSLNTSQIGGKHGIN